MISIQTNVGKQSISFMAKDIWNDLPTHLKNSSMSEFPKKFMKFIYCTVRKTNEINCCLANEATQFITQYIQVLPSLFNVSSSFDFTCHLEPKLFKELTRKLTSSFSFPACTLFSLHLIYRLLYVNLLDWNINHVHGQKHNNKDYHSMQMFLPFHQQRAHHMTCK